MYSTATVSMVYLITCPKTPILFLRLLIVERCLTSAIEQILLALGATYAAVPLYRAFCAATGFAGTPKTGAGEHLNLFNPVRVGNLSYILQENSVLKGYMLFTMPNLLK